MHDPKDIPSDICAASYDELDDYITANPRLGIPEGFTNAWVVARYFVGGWVSHVCNQPWTGDWHTLRKQANDHVVHLLEQERGHSQPPSDPNPLPGPTPHPGSDDGIEGQLTILRGGYAHGKGAVLPVLCHAGDALSRVQRGHRDWYRGFLDRIKARGYHGHQQWMCLGGEYWRGRELDPDHPRYLEDLAWSLREAKARGLVVGLSGGDVGYIRDRRQFVDGFADVLDEVGSDVAAWYEPANEGWQTGEPDPRRLAETLAKPFKARHPHVLCTLTAPETDERSDIVRWAIAPADFISMHHYRGGRLSDKARHAFSAAWWGEHGELPIRLLWSTEWTGWGAAVSVTENKHELDRDGSQVLALAGTLFRSGYTYFCGPGVKSDEGEGFDDMPGFVEVPALIRSLPQDIHRWQMYHGGDDRAWSADRPFRADGETRVDYVTDGLQFLALIHSPNGLLDPPEHRSLHLHRDQRFGHRGRLVHGEFR